MSQGVLFDPSSYTSNIKEVIYENYGNISAIADHYKVSRWTIYEYFKKNPDIKKILDDIRDYSDDSDLDIAEFTLRYAMNNYKKNLHLALRAADKVIDKKGHKRGWMNLSQLPPNDAHLIELTQSIKDAPKS